MMLDLITCKPKTGYAMGEKRKYLFSYIINITWLNNNNRLGHGGALVESIAFNRRVVGSTLALAATYGPWASPLPTVACALRRETPIQYPCCSRERL